MIWKRHLLTATVLQVVIDSETSGAEYVSLTMNRL